MKKITILFCLIIAGFTVSAQADVKSDSLKSEKKLLPEIKDIEIVQMLQLWDVNTFQNSGGVKNEKRNDFYIRRGRIGIKGKLRKDMAFTVVFAYDGIGRDKNTAGNGNPNEGDNRSFFLWDAFWVWNQSDFLNITAGYFRPQVGREHISSAFQTISLEKSLPNFLPRTHTFGRGSGRETGINIGGISNHSGWGLNYNVGLFDMTNELIVGNGDRWFPMLTGRMAFSLGDPEMDNYKISYAQTYYGKRKGITLAANGTYQGQTMVFDQNSFYGADLLFNYGRVDFIAEYDILYRNSLPDLFNISQTTKDKLYSAKLGYNQPLPNGKILQVSFTKSGLIADDKNPVEHVNPLTKLASQNAYDAGLNYLLNKDKLKFSLHYLWGYKRSQTKDPFFAFAAAGFQYQF